MTVWGKDRGLYNDANLRKVEDYKEEERDKSRWNFDFGVIIRVMSNNKRTENKSILFHS